jgi:hypothetical protein
MRSIVAAVSMVAVLGSSGVASAQRPDVEVYADGPDYYRAAPAPGASRYYYRSTEQRPVVVIPIRPANCGQYHYWNGERCIDARVVPPDLR